MGRAVTASILAFVFLGLFAGLSGCGYSWQSNDNPWDNQGVTKVYIPTFRNNTLRTGAEVVFTSAMIKEFARGKRIKIVSSRDKADAILVGTVTDITTLINSTAPVPSLTNDSTAAATLSDMSVASIYQVSATITLTLVRKKDGSTLWYQTFSQSKLYPGGNRYGLIGSTSELIDGSQEQLALGDVAQFIASDAYDTMLEAF